MTNIAKIRRSADEHPKPGTWVPVTLDGEPTARMGCPGCGNVALLSDHQIGSDGLVSPSVDCPECEYHVNGVILVGWDQ